MVVGWGMDTAMSDGSSYPIRAEGMRARAEWRSEVPTYEVPDDLRIDPAWNEGQHATRVSEQLVQQLEALVLKGRTPEAAKAELFIVPRCWKKWRDNAQRGEQPYATMFERLKLARKRYEARKLGRLDDISECEDPAVALRGTVKALEYANPARYAPKTAPTPSGSTTTNVQINVGTVNALASIDPTRLAALAAAFSGRLLTETTAPTPVLPPDEDE